MNQSDCSGKILKLWPVFVDHFTTTPAPPVVELSREKTLAEVLREASEQNQPSPSAEDDDKDAKKSNNKPFMYIPY